MILLNQVLDFFISSANAAATTPASPTQGGGTSVFIMVGIFVFFLYFTVWRPQNKRAKEQKDLINSIAKGDEVLTVGGIIGKVVKLSDSYAVLSIADNVDVTVLKSSIANALPKGTLKSI